MRARQVSAAIGLSATVFAGSLICAPVGAAASDFSNYLAQGYSQLAKVAAKTPVSLLYKKRSTVAAGGQAIEPLQPDAAHLDALTVNEARIYREQLIEGLQAGGRQRQPLLAAIAQVNYDCWVMPLPKRKGAPRSAECHQRFLQAFEGLPDKHHRGPISSVEPWQLAAAAVVVSPPARSGSDAIGALILSLSSPSLSQRTLAYDSALASTYAVGQQPPDGQMEGQVMGNCDDHCLAMSFSGPGTAPLIAALIDDRERKFRGPGDSGAGQQSASAGTSDGSSGTGGSGSPNSGQNGNGQTTNGQGTSNSGGSVGSDGSGSGSPGSGSADSGSSGSSGPGSGGPGSGGPGNGNGNGHGHHGHGGGG
jgi:hypothetical protein